MIAIDFHCYSSAQVRLRVRSSPHVKGRGTMFHGLRGTVSKLVDRCIVQYYSHAAVSYARYSIHLSIRLSVTLESSAAFSLLLPHSYYYVECSTIWRAHACVCACVFVGVAS